MCNLISFMWMRSSRVVRASDSQKCRSRNCPEAGVLENPTQVSQLSGVYSAELAYLSRETHTHISKTEWFTSFLDVNMSDFDFLYS